VGRKRRRKEGVSTLFRPQIDKKGTPRRDVPYLWNRINGANASASDEVII
jgi:hypothetical protein